MNFSLEMSDNEAKRLIGKLYSSTKGNLLIYRMEDNITMYEFKGRLFHSYMLNEEIRDIIIEKFVEPYVKQ